MRLLIVLSLAGLGISLYVWRKQVTHAPLFCLTRDCHRVINSPYARLFGVPNGALGCLMFGALALIGLGVEAGLTWAFLQALAVAIALAGVALAAYLTYVQFFVLRGLCSWCLLSAALTVGILVLLVW